MPAKNRTVAAITLGCKVNQYDTNAMLHALEEDGFTVVDWADEATLRLVNTCTVTAVADAKSRNMIRKAAKSGSKVVVCGCLAQKDAQAAGKIEGVHAVVTMDRRVQIANIAREILGEEAAASAEKLVALDAGQRTRGVLKIQEGCANFCTYCIIPHVRGKPISRSEQSIVDEAMQMVQNGVREIVVTGIHICSYGMDTGESLTQLLARLDAIDGIARIRLGSLEPGFLNEQVIDEVATLTHVCPHFHVSLQSGCAKTLRAMGRRYTPEEYAQGVQMLRHRFDNPAVTTDIMTGFAGESEEDFAKSIAFVSAMGFARCHVFPYSEREGTPAARMKEGVPVNVRKERAKRMIAVCREAEAAYAYRFLGSTQNVLLDKAEENGLSGYTDRYVRVYVPDGPVGHIVPVQLETIVPGGCAGHVVHA